MVRHPAMPCAHATPMGIRQSRLARAAPTALLFEHSTKAGSQIVAARRYSDAALKNYALIPVVPAVPIMMVVRVIGVVTMVIVGIVTIVMMVVRMRIIAVPSCGWNRASDCDCTDNA